MELIEVQQCHAQVTLQDLGRSGGMASGFAQGGAMDIKALCWANRLLGKPSYSAVLEITVGRVELKFLADIQCALAGADLGAKLDGKDLSTGSVFAVKAGEVLSFTAQKNGFRAYLATTLALETEQHFGSSGAVVRESYLQHASNSLLTKGDIVSGSHSQQANNSLKAIPPEFLDDYSKPLTLKLIPSYQFELFDPKAIDTLLTSEYQIQNSSNRMAYALNGEPLNHSIGSMLSQGIAYGAVQIPPSGQPVILLNERQTTGGYPIIGCISKLSAFSLSQHYYPQKARFELIDIDQAEAEWREFRAFFGL